MGPLQLCGAALWSGVCQDLCRMGREEFRAAIQEEEKCVESGGGSSQLEPFC